MSLSISQLADYFKIHRTSVADLIKSGDLRATKRGRAFWVSKTNLERFIKVKMEKLYTVEEVAAIIGRHPINIRNMINEGRLSAIKVGKLWRVRESDLTHLIPQKSIKFYSIKKTAQILRIHRLTVLKLIEEKRLKAYKIGGTLRIPEEEIEKLLDGKVEKLYTIDELAKILKVHRIIASLLLRRKRIKAIKYDGIIRIKQSEIEDFLRTKIQPIHTIDELALELKKSRGYVSNLIATDTIKFFRIGKLYRITEEDFQEYLQKISVKVEKRQDQKWHLKAGLLGFLPEFFSAQILALTALFFGFIFFLYSLKYYASIVLMLFYSNKKYSKYNANNNNILNNNFNNGYQPFVSIHIPFYNEKKVANRILAACTNLDYENYEVIVVDDSTDETVQILEKWQTHPKVKIIHRDTRTGFKGGALQNALKLMHPDTQYVIVFDADFIPYPDTIKQFLKYFYAHNKQLTSDNKNLQPNSYHLAPNNNLAAVQGYQWHVLNKNENWITRGVRTEYAGSYVIERPANEIFKAIKMIAGSVYMVRADVLRAYGWGTSITEDFQLTLRLYKDGYKVLFTPYIQTPSECVSTLKRLIRQRMRWAEGHTFNVKKMFWKLMRSKYLTRREKLEFIYLTPYYLQAAFLLIGTLCWFISDAIFHIELPFWTKAWGWSLVFTNFLALPLMNAAGLFMEEAESKDYKGILSFVALCYLVTPFQAYAAIKGLIETNEGGWFRTPKTGHITDTMFRSRFRRFLKAFFPGHHISQAQDFQITPNYLKSSSANQQFDQFQVKRRKPIKNLGKIIIVFMAILVSLGIFRTIMFPNSSVNIPSKSSLISNSGILSKIGTDRHNKGNKDQGEVTVSENEKRISLGNNLFKMDVAKAADSKVAYFNTADEKLIKNEDFYLEIQKDGIWQKLGNMTKIESQQIQGGYSIIKTYQDNSGTLYKVNRIMRQDEPIKLKIEVQAGKAGQYRAKWEVKGIAGDQEFKGTDSLSYGPDAEEYSVKIDYSDVTKTLGNVSSVISKQTGSGFEIDGAFGPFNLKTNQTLIIDPTISTSEHPFATGQNGTRKLVRESGGNLHAVYHKQLSTKFQIYTKDSSDDGDTWANETRISIDGTEFNGYHQFYPSIAIDSSNNLHVVWHGSTTTYTINQIWYSKYSSGSWSTPLRISTYTDMNAYAQSSPAIAIDGSNNLHVVWYGSQTYYDPVFQIWYTKYSGSWSDPIVISTDALQGSYDQTAPAIEIEDNNNLHVVWSGKGTDYGTANQIWHTEYTASWSAPLRISDYTAMNLYAQASPSLVIEKSDDVHVFWYGLADGYTTFNQIWHREYTGSWQTTERISDGAGMNGEHQFRPSAAKDINDYIHVFWHGQDTTYPTRDQIFYREYTASWQAIVAKTTDDSITHFYPNVRWSMFHNNGGYLMWVWAENNASPYDIEFAKDTSITIPETSFWLIPILMFIPLIVRKYLLKVKRKNEKLKT